MSNFNFDDDNVMVMSKIDGWAVELWWQNGDSMQFSIHQTMEDAESTARDLRRVMHERAAAMARLGYLFCPSTELFEAPDDDASRVAVVRSDIGEMVSGPIPDADVSEFLESFEGWSDEWLAVVDEPAPDEVRAALGDLLAIVTDDLFDGGHFTCDEADVIAGHARRFLSDESADDFLHRHALGDIDGVDSPDHLALLG